MIYLCIMKTQKTVRSYTLDPENIEAMDALAVKTERSASYHVNKAMKEYLKKQK